MGENWLELFNQNTLQNKVQETNAYTKKYGLALSKEDTRLLLEERKRVLKTHQRAEFGAGILPQIIYMFCDSDFISQDNYVESMVRLQEIFYLYKNEMLDEITDEELIHFMREQFEEVCFGDLSYLEGTCLRIFSEAIRAGYQGHRKSGGYGNFDEVKRWDYELYLAALENLF